MKKLLIIGAFTLAIFSQVFSRGGSGRARHGRGQGGVHRYRVWRTRGNLGHVFNTDTSSWNNEETVSYGLNAGGYRSLHAPLLGLGLLALALGDENTGYDNYSNNLNILRNNNHLNRSRNYS